MKKFIWPALVAMILLAQPLVASAACCRTIRYSEIDLPVLIDTPYNTVEQASTPEECLDNCSGLTLEGTLTTWLALNNPTLAPAIIAASILNYKCQNFYYPGLTARSADESCIGASMGCCQVTIDKKSYLNYAANSRSGESYADSECALYCKGRDVDSCSSEFIANAKPNLSTGKCETVPLDTPLPVAPSTSGIGGTGAVSLTNPLNSGSIPSLISNVINWLLSIMGAIALAIFVYGGFMWLTSAGNDKKVAAGKDALKWAAIGLGCVFFSYIAVGFILELFGVI